MEIKATLNKPYTKEQRLDFIVTYNGYQIKETKTALEAWGYAEAEKQAQAKEARKKKLIEDLAKLDLKQIRSLATIAAGASTDEDIAILAGLEEQKAIKRQELKDLQGE